MVGEERQKPKKSTWKISVLTAKNIEKNTIQQRKEKLFMCVGCVVPLSISLKRVMEDKMPGRIYFEYQFNKTAAKASLELSPEATLEEIIEAFERFLKAAGYVFNGQLIIDYKEPNHD